MSDSETPDLVKIYTRLLKAYKGKKGIRLSADEVYDLCTFDDAIEQVLLNIESNEDEE